ncbi:MAG: hypothetical protein HOO96_08225, partial [Polyangiaceae bacterium]|nr:hypothetical protein [Polyangiaceae bacterium]
MPSHLARRRRPGRLRVGLAAKGSAARARTEDAVNAAWERVHQELDAQGYARIPGLLSAAACDEVVALYGDAALFRSRVVMGRHGFGRGEYQYFADPLPPRVADLRRDVYPKLSGVANAWAERSGLERRFPGTHADLRAECAAAGQSRPTPLLLKYGPGDYNCLHQDLYGDLVFPLQLAILLSQPGDDFEGGELVLTTQRPRMQSRVDVVPLARIIHWTSRPVSQPRELGPAFQHGHARLELAIFERASGERG